MSINGLFEKVKVAFKKEWYGVPLILLRNVTLRWNSIHFFFIEDGTALVEQPISFWCLSCYRRHIPERQEKSDYSPYGCLRQRQRELNSTSCTKKKKQKNSKRKKILCTIQGHKNDHLLTSTHGIDFICLRARAISLSTKVQVGE